MIDREGRNRLGVALRRLASGRLTNTGFDAIRVDHSPDEALVAIGDAGWLLYGDFGVYRLTGRRSLTAEVRAAVARWVVFLDTDLPYEWRRFRPTIWELALDCLTLGVSHRRKLRSWRGSGPFHLWPFFRERDYTAASASPRRFAGDPPRGLIQGNSSVVGSERAAALRSH